MTASRTFRSGAFGNKSVSALSLGKPAAVYPGAVAGDSDMIIAVDRQQTQLAAPLNATDTSMTVADASMITAYNLLSIDNEIVKTTAAPTGNVVPIQRAFDGTTAAVHLQSAAVSGFTDAYHHNRLVAEVEAIEQTLGANLSHIASSHMLYHPQYAWTPQSPGVTLAAGSNAITLNPIPAGIAIGNGVYISGGTGAAEVASITGWNSATGAIIFTCANAHSGAYTIQSATAGVDEALQVAAAGDRILTITGGANTIYGPVHVPQNMTGGLVTGYGATLSAGAGFSGSSMMIGDHNLSVFTLEGLTLFANSTASITTGINFSRPETSVNDTFIKVRVYGMVGGGVAWNLDGCEDTLLLHCISDGGPTAYTNFTDIQCHVPYGNIRIAGCTMFNTIVMNAQVATIVECTHGAIVADGTMGFLGLYGSYFYPNNYGGNAGNLFSINSGWWQAIEISACYMVLGMAGCVCFRGAYNARIAVRATIFDGGGTAGVTLFSTAAGGTSGGGQFYFENLTMQSGAALGTPSSTLYVLFPPGLILAETGANNAIAGNLAGVATWDGLTVRMRLAHTLQAGANTFNLNSTTPLAIMSSRNPANNIAVAYVAGSMITLCYSAASNAWLDMSQ